MRELMEVGCLVIDDVGRETDAGAMTMMLEDVIDARCDLRTVITTNLDAAAWRARYPDERLASRLHAHARFVAVVGPDLRRNPPGGTDA